MEQLRLSQLSLDEIQRVHSTLRDRYTLSSNPDILQIAFGLAERGGVAERGRGPCICFYVRRKQSPENLPPQQRIDPTIHVRVKRGEQFVELVAPTDVIELSEDAVQLTGLPIRHSNQTSATTGILLAWRRPHRRQLAWGVLTVGHIFPAHLSLPEDEVNVEISTSVAPLAARLVARADRAEIDAALCVVRRKDLVHAQLIPADFHARGRVFKTNQQLIRSIGRRGYSMPSKQRHSFQYARYLLEAPIFEPLLGFVPRNVIHSVAGEDLFRPGTSGSPWSIGRLAAGMQFASMHPAYRQGFGQTLADILPWSRSAVAKLNGVADHQIDLRFVRCF
jgi:hypothetical protein